MTLSGACFLPITDDEFNRIRNLIYDRVGISLSHQKKGLLVSRLQGMMRNMGLSTFSEYYKYILEDQTGQAVIDLVNRISTNFTYFLREKAHFDFLTNVVFAQITSLLNTQNSRDIRVWCAGCSTGEEAYSLMILMMEYFGDRYALWDIGLLATDISANALKKAKAGIYSPEQIKSLPKHIVLKYFSQTHDQQWQVVNRVRAEVIFRSFNLVNPVFPFKKPFHIIFCRNVMIYFDKPTRDTLIKKYYNFTLPGGYLFIGHSESIDRSLTSYQYVMPAVYRRE
ncbi:MAG: protein-glutamate O-methyltransferase CheR [Desulfobacterales bacterium]|nr:protein-glutamate O-methyltransferase CheR [Desulfobacterales bacterium]